MRTASSSAPASSASAPPTGSRAPASAWCCSKRAVVPTIPVAGMALILGIDRFMSEARALTNITGNAVATVVISASEKELDRERMALALDGKLDDEVVVPVIEPALVPAR